MPDMRQTLCSYVLKHDFGFCPNPFSGYCTLAACTPNHLGCNLKKNDWIMGHSTAETGHKLIYAMRVCEVVDMDDYWRDERFTQKKANGNSRVERCGDNIYYKKDGNWIQALAFFHLSPTQIAQDTKHHKVFVSDHFFYFGAGADAKDIPDKFADLIQRRQGVSYHTEPIVQEFIKWLEENFKLGQNGEPRDQQEGIDCDDEPEVC